MQDRNRFFDDIAGVAGGAFSALNGLREEMESMFRARLDEAIRRLDLVRREDFEAVEQMAANARAGQETAEQALAALEARVAALEMALNGAASGAGGGAPPHPAETAEPGAIPDALAPRGPEGQTPKA